MPKGRALCIGLNAVDPGHYGGWSGLLNACEADAQDMSSITQSRGFATKTLLTKQGTRAAMAAEIKSAASALSSGDIFVMSYSGHGGQLPDLNGDEYDAQDETMCLYDGQLTDDELNAQLAAFKPGVRVLVFSDSCHSGSVVKLAYYDKASSPPATVESPSRQVAYRFMPSPIALRTYRENRAFYDAILKDKTTAKAAKAVQAYVLLVSGCQDNQLSADGDFNGLFTANLLRVWNEGSFRGNYVRFHQAILRLMPPDQTPNLFRTGRRNLRFEAQQPFKI